MKITKVWAVYFSPTGNTKKVITTMAKKAAEVLSVPMETFDFTLPENREGVTSFESEDLVFFSTPVYAGRIPNKMLPYVQSAFEGNGAFAVPVSVFGNRNFDNGLIELRNELELHGFHTIAAAGSRQSMCSAISLRQDVRMRMISRRSRNLVRRSRRKLLI